MEASNIKRLKNIEAENRRLKLMYANLNLEYVLLKNIVEKTAKPVLRRELTDYARDQHGASL